MTLPFVHAAAGSIIALALLSTGVLAQNYPERWLRIIVGFSAGGATDVGARLVAQQLAPLLGQAVVVENKPGAGGEIAQDFVAKAPPGGYTLLMASAGNATQPAIRRELPFDPVKDFAWISTVTTYPFVIVTGPQAPFKSLADFIARAKAEPGKFSWGSAGVGTSGHLLGEWLSDATGIELLHVPYKGQANALIEVIAGRINLDIEPLVQMVPHVKAGKMRALAVTSREPSSFLPEVPTAVQAVPGYVFQSWLGVAAPAATSPEIVARLNRELRRLLADPEVQKRLTEIGGVAAPSSPEEMRAQVASEVDRWRQLVKNRRIEQH